MTSGVIVFLVLAVIAVGSAVSMLFSRNTVYSALFLIISFLSVAVLYLILGAPFIALAQITVYAGAIMVLFLFVIMLLGAERMPEKETVKWQRPVAVLLGLGLAAEGIWVILNKSDWTVMSNPGTEALADPANIGMALFSKYALPFEITSVILLVAVIGAVVLSRSEKKKGEK